MDEDCGSLVVVRTRIRAAIALRAHAVGNGVLCHKGGKARIAHGIVVHHRGHGKITVRIKQVFPVDGRHLLVEFADVAAGRAQQGNQDAVRGDRHFAHDRMMGYLLSVQIFIFDPLPLEVRQTN